MHKNTREPGLQLLSPAKLVRLGFVVRLLAFPFDILIEGLGIKATTTQKPSPGHKPTDRDSKLKPGTNRIL